MNINLKKIICILFSQVLIANSFIFVKTLPVYADVGINESIIGSTLEIGTEISSSEKMKWVVLDIDSDNSNKVFLITKDIVDVREFSDEPSNYKNSKIRYYLNNEFFEKNFSDEEKKHIVETKIESITNLTDDNTLKKNVVETNDRVFLLSEYEIQKYTISSMHFWSNSYVMKLVGDIYNLKYWTRDTYNDLLNARCVNDSSMIKTPQAEYSGVVVGMWYDLISTTEMEQTYDEKLIEERSGGKKHDILFSEDEIDNAINFNINTSLFENRHRLEFGQYEIDNKEKPLKWIITEYDGENIVLILDKILEYKEIDYDIYDKEKLQSSPYNYSNIKSYLNKKLVNKIFNEEQKKILVNIDEDEYISIPSFEEVYKWNLCNEKFRKNMLVDDLVSDIYNIADIRYFLKEFDIKDGLPYPLSLNLFNEEASNTIDYKNDKYENIVSKYFNICSGIRPIIKLNVAKLKNYLKNDMEYLSEYKPIVPFKGKVKFGKYEQDGNIANGKEDIEWLVIKKRGGVYLLFANKILDVLDLSNEINVSEYRNSVLYSFSNFDFLNEAFTNEEKKMLKIVETKSAVGDYATFFSRYKFNINLPETLPEYSKVLSLNLSLGIENYSYLYNDIMKTETTEFVKNKYKGVSGYLKQDICKYYTYMASLGSGYLQVGMDGKYLETKQDIGGFRPIICIGEEDLLKIVNKGTSKK